MKNVREMLVNVCSLACAALLNSNILITLVG